MHAAGQTACDLYRQGRYQAYANRWLKRFLVAATLEMLVLSAINPAIGHPFLADQTNTPPRPLTQSIQSFSPIGQEFTPTMASLDVVELLTRDFGSNVNGLGADLFVRIRTNTIGGTIVGTSNIVSLSDGFDGVTHFDFASSVSLVPGNLYVIDVNVASGDNWGIKSSGGPFSTYPGGNQVLNGLPRSNNDLWFREGPIPEPSTLAFTSLALMGINYRRL